MFKLKCYSKIFVLSEKILFYKVHSTHLHLTLSSFIHTGANPMPCHSIIEEPKNANYFEKNFLIKIKNDPDRFGTTNNTEEIADEGDINENRHFEEQSNKRLRTKQYADLIKELIRNRKIKEAIDVLEIRMIKEDKVKPENYIFNLVIGACGQVGYTKKAFSLFNKMKQRNLKITGGTYTALFNACSNSPWSEDGLTRAKHLRDIMIRKMYEPNDSNYNAMIKAFGRCGDLSIAFSIADEMKAKNFKIKDDTINFLLQACITDKDAGLRHALLVWRKCINSRIKFSTFSYNLLLRSVRDCGLGDLQITEDVLKQILKNNDLLQIDKGKGKLLLSCENHSSLSLLNRTPRSTSLLTTDFGPNLIAQRPHLGNMLSLSEVTKPEDRLLLIGGMNGVLTDMQQNRCAPNIKTFTQLLDTIPSTLACEKELLLAFKKFQVKPDLDFYNMLIKKRSMRFDYSSAKDVLVLIQKDNFRPDLITYGVLALGCKTKEDALELLEEMKTQKYRINTEIVGAMLRQACFHINFPYVLEMMETCIKEEIPPNEKFMDHLVEFKKKCKVISNDKSNPLSLKTSFQKGYEVFKMRYKTWSEEVTKEGSNIHPWQQYRQTTNTDVSKFKEDKNSKFKARHISKFKVKTSTKNRY